MTCPEVNDTQVQARHMHVHAAWSSCSIQAASCPRPHDCIFLLELFWLLLLWLSQTMPGRHPDVWYQLLLACAATTQCQAARDNQLPTIMQRLQDSGHGTTAFDLARGICDAQKRVAEAQAALRKANTSLLGAQNEVQEQLEADGHPVAYDLLCYLNEKRHHSEN